MLWDMTYVTDFSNLTVLMTREVRIACTVAQMEREGGISPRVSPLAQVLYGGKMKMPISLFNWNVSISSMQYFKICIVGIIHLLALMLISPRLIVEGFCLYYYYYFFPWQRLLFISLICLFVYIYCVSLRESSLVFCQQRVTFLILFSCFPGIK